MEERSADRKRGCMEFGQAYSVDALTLMLKHFLVMAAEAFLFVTIGIHSLHFAIGPRQMDIVTI